MGPHVFDHAVADGRLRTRHGCQVSVADAGGGAVERVAGHDRDGGQLVLHGLVIADGRAANGQLALGAAGQNVVVSEAMASYLRSRGVPEALARRMLTGAFCRSVVDAMGSAAVRDAFQERLEAGLERAS